MPTNDGTLPDLGDLERSLLENAVRDGYFTVPRRVTLTELAEQHGITSREASETMRRGLEKAVRHAVLGENARP